MTHILKDLDTASFMFRSRGLGLNRYPCFLCGHIPNWQYQADMAAFIAPDLVRVLQFPDEKPIVSHPILDFFSDLDILANLDFRTHEPNRVQLKLGACAGHKPNLELLGYLTDGNSQITKKIVDRVIPGRKVP